MNKRITKPKYDLTGQKFGNLTVEYLCDYKKINKDGTSLFLWHCKCDCIEKGYAKEGEGYIDVPTAILRNGSVRSCGGAFHYINDITGQRFGKLTAIKYLHTKYTTTGKSQGSLWLCKCDCGNERTVILKALRDKSIYQCEKCAEQKRLESIKQRAINQTKHGLSYSRIRTVWRGMMKRCYYQKHPEYNNYGGAGISVCDEWSNKENGLINFARWAEENGYDPNADFGKCTLDRIDPYGNYEPNNCQWISLLEQSHNKKKHLIIKTDDGKEWYSWELSDISGLTQDTINKRYKRGITDYNTLIMPHDVFLKRNK